MLVLMLMSHASVDFFVSSFVLPCAYAYVDAYVARFSGFICFVFLFYLVLMLMSMLMSHASVDLFVLSFCFTLCLWLCRCLCRTLQWIYLFCLFVLPCAYAYVDAYVARFSGFICFVFLFYLVLMVMSMLMSHASVDLFVLSFCFTLCLCLCRCLCRTLQWIYLFCLFVLPCAYGYVDAYVARFSGFICFVFLFYLVLMLMSMLMSHASVDLFVLSFCFTLCLWLCRCLCRTLQWIYLFCLFVLPCAYGYVDAYVARFSGFICFVFLFYLVLMLMSMLMSHASVDLFVSSFVLPCAYAYVGSEN